MFNLNNASISIRKAASLQGVNTGKFKPVFDPSDKYNAVIAVVYNRNHPVGIEISAGDAIYADHLTWSEIRNR